CSAGVPPKHVLDHEISVRALTTTAGYPSACVEMPESNRIRNEIVVDPIVMRCLVAHTADRDTRAAPVNDVVAHASVSGIWIQLDAPSRVAVIDPVVHDLKVP